MSDRRCKPEFANPRIAFLRPEHERSGMKETALSRNMLKKCKPPFSTESHINMGDTIHLTNMC